MRTVRNRRWRKGRVRPCRQNRCYLRTVCVSRSTCCSLCRRPSQLFVYIGGAVVPGSGCNREAGTPKKMGGRSCEKELHDGCREAFNDQQNKQQGPERPDADAIATALAVEVRTLPM